MSKVSIFIILVMSTILGITAITESFSIVYAEKDNEKDDLSERDVDVLCDASEDYEAHKEQCDKLYDSVEEDATLAFASSEEEEHCEDNAGNWSKEDKECKFDDEDDQEEYDEKKYKHFANKPENRGYSDWEYPESDK